MLTGLCGDQKPNNKEIDHACWDTHIIGAHVSKAYFHPLCVRICVCVCLFIYSVRKAQYTFAE